MYYRGYRIIKEHHYYRIYKGSAPLFTADTIEEAQAIIDEESEVL